MTKSSGAFDHVTAAGWGFAEATVFFIVPDAWISWVALRSPRRSLATTLSSLAGSLAGGTVMYAWGARTSEADSRKDLAKLPAISEAMVDRIAGEVREDGLRAMMRGPLRGVPYKIYGRTAGLQDQSLRSFLAWSVPARMVRFVAVSLGTTAVVAGARKIMPARADKLAPVVHVISWSAFYTWFFKTVGRD